MKPLYPEDSSYRTYGRSVGKALKAGQKQLFADHMPRLAIDLEVSSETFIASLRARGFEAIVLEIGFGGAEHLLARAKENPTTFYLGVEPFLNGVVKAVEGIVSQDLKNVALLRGDARDLIRWLPENCLELCYILYPDPWPKKRHNKRRLFNDYLLSELSRVMQPISQLRFASDIVDYVDWALFEALKSPHFEWRGSQKADWTTPWPNWQSTRYEAKALREGRACHYITFHSVKK